MGIFFFVIFCIVCFIVFWKVFEKGINDLISHLKYEFYYKHLNKKNEEIRVKRDIENKDFWKMLENLEREKIDREDQIRRSKMSPEAIVAEDKRNLKRYQEIEREKHHPRELSPEVKKEIAYITAKEKGFIKDD